MRHRPKRENYPSGTYGDMDYQEYLERYCTYLENKNKALTKQCNIDDVSSSRFVSATCKGEKCSVCGKNATNKLGEEIPYDDPNPNRHNLTAYVCREHFRMIVGRLG